MLKNALLSLSLLVVCEASNIVQDKKDRVKGAVFGAMVADALCLGR
jgi:hypothetical protein